MRNNARFHYFVRTFTSALLLQTAACGTASQPRTNDAMPIEKFQTLGPVADASRAFPLAFYANPVGPPEFVDVDKGLGGTKVATGAWLTELARNMNKAMAQVSLYDARFLEQATAVFQYDVENGDIVYRYREPAEGLKTKARVAKMKLVSLKTSSGADGTTVVIHVEVQLGTFVHIYGCEVTDIRWDAAAFACIGEKVLGDASLWKAAQSN